MLLSGVSDSRSQIQDMQLEELPNDVLVRIFSQLMRVEDMCACSRVCRQWNAVIYDSKADCVWKRCALQNLLGKQVWEEHVCDDVGQEPRYRIAGQPVPWLEVCKIQRAPSLFRTENGKMVEVDILVPAIIDGQPTTINRVLEVFARANKPIGCRYIYPGFQEVYGDIPIEESYIARITFTVDEDTRGKEPDTRVSIIHKKGQGKYRPFMGIEHMIFIFLAHQVGLKHGYGQDPWRYTQYIETLEVNGKTYPMMGGGFEEPAPGAPVGLCVGYSGYVNGDLGAGGLRKF
jgi:hypothetical protein